MLFNYKILLKKKVIYGFAFSFHQIKCRSCSQQKVCCKCIPGVYRNMIPCPCAGPSESSSGDC